MGPVPGPARRGRRAERRTGGGVQAWAQGPGPCAHDIRIFYVLSLFCLCVIYVLGLYIFKCYEF